METKNLAADLRFPFKNPRELESYLPYLITRLSNRWAANQDCALKDVGLNNAKMRILASLAAFGELTINDVSVLSVTEQSTTSRTVEQLVTSNLVERKIDSRDQRLRTVKLTSSGLQTLKKLSQPINELYQNLISDVTEEELQICIETLGKILLKVKSHKI